MSYALQTRLAALIQADLPCLHSRAIRVQLNQWLRTGLANPAAVSPYLSGVIDICTNNVESSVDSSIWACDASVYATGTGVRDSTSTWMFSDTSRSYTPTLARAAIFSSETGVTKVGGGWASQVQAPQEAERTIGHRRLWTSKH